MTTLVHWDEQEPYLSPPSHPQIRITPYRESEADLLALERISNDPRVARWSFGRPSTFTRADARARFDEMVPAQAGAAAVLGKGKGGRVPLNPFSVIRQDGAYIGDLALFPADELDADATAVNTGSRVPPTQRRAVPGAMWTLAYALDPAVHGRGIGTAAVHTLLEWARGEMGVTRVESTCETANVASNRLLQKLGFKCVETRMQAWPAHNGGGEREVATYVRE